jgi:hypothetical protein
MMKRRVQISCVKKRNFASIEAMETSTKRKTQKNERKTYSFVLFELNRGAGVALVFNQ